jgi:group I intron endonuclease
MGQPGIYILRNSKNGKIYVGQSRVNVERRSGHPNRNKKHPIDLAIRKYGIDNFERFIFYIPEELLDDFERAMIKNLHSLSPCGYNLETGGCKNKHTCEETKRKISEALRGKPGHWLGRKHSEETKRKMSRALMGNTRNLGRKFSEEHKKKISEGQRGKVLSEEQKKRLSQVRRGIKLSEETKRKISEAFKGKRLSEEHKGHIAEARKRYWQRRAA